MCAPVWRNCSFCRYCELKVCCCTGTGTSSETFTRSSVSVNVVSPMTKCSPGTMSNSEAGRPLTKIGLRAPGNCRTFSRCPSQGISACWRETRSSHEVGQQWGARPNVTGRSAKQRAPPAMLRIGSLGDQIGHEWLLATPPATRLPPDRGLTVRVMA